MKLICFDMDGVIFESRSFWLELHKAFGTYKEGKKLTKKYLYSDYPRLVKEVVGRLWKGREASRYYELINSFDYLPGVPETFQSLRNKGYSTAIISAASIDLARRVQRDFLVEHIYANDLVIRDGRLTGEFLSPLAHGGKRKAEILRHLSKDRGVRMKDTVFIGDSEIDIEAFREAGLAIAFNPVSEKVKKAAIRAKGVVVESNVLSDVLKVID